MGVFLFLIKIGRDSKRVVPRLYLVVHIYTQGVLIPLVLYIQRPALPVLEVVFPSIFR